MTNGTLEQIVDAPKQGKNEEKQTGVLESVLGEISDATKAVANLSVGIAVPAAGYALTGDAGVLATSTSFVAATKGKKDSKTIRNESLSGAIFGTFAHYVLGPLKYLTDIGKIAYMSLFPLAANSFYMAEEHLIKNLSIKGLYQKFKDNYWTSIKKTFKSIVPLNMTFALLLPQQYMVGAIAVASFIFRRFVVGGKRQEYEDKRPYLVAASSGIGKIFRNAYKVMHDTVYSLGSALSPYKYSPQPA